MQLTVRGVPCIYYGEEIGMTDSKLPYKTALDPIPHLYPGLTRGFVELADETLNRDDVRTPMQWDTTKQAGFSTANTTWLPVNSNYNNVNVSMEEKDSTSLLKTIKRLLQIRNNTPALSHGSLTLINNGLPKGVLGYTRQYGANTYTVLLNFSNKIQQCTTANNNHLLYGLHNTDSYAAGVVTLAPYGAVIIAGN